MATAAKNILSTISGTNSIDDVSPTSKELVLALSGLAGAGCSSIAAQMEALLETKSYTVHRVKISELISEKSDMDIPIVQKGGGKLGQTKLDRAVALQDAGDDLRKNIGEFVLASFAVEKIKKSRGATEVGSAKNAYIIDSLKHPSEVDLLRKVYGPSFKLLAVHCDQKNRERRLIGGAADQVKFAGAEKIQILQFMKRDEDDGGKKFGQHVKDVFHRADFFLDNSQSAPQAGAAANPDLDRFFDLVLGNNIYRPTIGEKAIFQAFGAAAQSSCLSRQVGACLVSPSGQIVALGTNDPPKFGGGVYQEGDAPDNRCSKFEFVDGDVRFTGCHNDRKKKELRSDILKWAESELIPAMADVMYDRVSEAKKNENAKSKISETLPKVVQIFDGIPGIRGLIEFSRSIHAEMDALLAAAREGIRTSGCDLYVTTYPCHSCARHLVAAGIRNVFFVEPYAKSLALELHSDSITNSLPSESDGDRLTMAVVPFTGVGPAMYQEAFVKKGELKNAEGALDMPSNGLPDSAVRLSELSTVEDRAIDLVKNTKTRATTGANDRV
jgi:deoxycytidylate deaminase